MASETGTVASTVTFEDLRQKQIDVFQQMMQTNSWDIELTKVKDELKKMYEALAKFVPGNTSDGLQRPETVSVFRDFELQNYLQELRFVVVSKQIQKLAEAVESVRPKIGNSDDSAEQNSKVLELEKSLHDAKYFWIGFNKTNIMIYEEINKKIMQEHLTRFEKLAQFRTSMQAYTKDKTDILDKKIDDSFKKLSAGLKAWETKYQNLCASTVGEHTDDISQAVEKYITRQLEMKAEKEGLSNEDYIGKVLDMVKETDLEKTKNFVSSMSKVGDVDEFCRKVTIMKSLLEQDTKMIEEISKRRSEDLIKMSEEKTQFLLFVQDIASVSNFLSSEKPFFENEHPDDIRHIRDFLEKSVNGIYEKNVRNRMADIDKRAEDIQTKLSTALENVSKDIDNYKQEFESMRAVFRAIEKSSGAKKSDREESD
ncbi:hypothetical protein CYMTET_47295 [Cymbomonas tetramitiformis]|uniref:Uncharacterized protein n=1 Tax=Cymbomonas tetramitiformis TaxID=36881 RepID=A0AAE0BUG2_9CHLO|nr:hypothetical protein CYMTET_47295 [Cymbomonas tetramitiformis]